MQQPLPANQAAAGQYAIPPAGMPPMLDGLKPTWKGLKGSGASANPIAEIVGLCQAWDAKPNSFGDTQVNLHFSNCQVIKADAVFPYAEWTLSIKYSDSQNSGWGIFGESVAEALGINIELLDIDLLKGQWCHILREDGHSFGTNRQTSQEMLGTAWHLVETIQPGAQVTPRHPSLQQAALVAQVVATPTLPALTPIPSTPAPTPAMLGNTITDTAVSSPVAASIPTVDTPELSQDPTVRVMQLLHGKDLATFFQLAVPDLVLRTDPMLINSILSNVFVPGKLASGEVVQNPNGTYSVRGM